MNRAPLLPTVYSTNMALSDEVNNIAKKFVFFFPQPISTATRDTNSLVGLVLSDANERKNY